MFSMLLLVDVGLDLECRLSSVEMKSKLVTSCMHLGVMLKPGR